MYTYLDQVVYSRSLRSTLSYGDIEWDVECFITSFKPPLKVSKHPKKIKHLMGKYEKVLGDLPPGRPLDRGVDHTIELEIGN